MAFLQRCKPLSAQDSPNLLFQIGTIRAMPAVVAVLVGSRPFPVSVQQSLRVGKRCANSQFVDRRFQEWRLRGSLALR